jgi:hypothetical protein
VKEFIDILEGYVDSHYPGSAAAGRASDVERPVQTA